MTPAERVARLKQLYDQVKALNEEIARLEAEDEQFVAFKQRSAQAGRKPMSYADFVRYSAYRDQLEAAWLAAGRPRVWEQTALLVRLRDVLLVPAAADAGPGPATGASTGRVIGRARAAPAEPAPSAPSAPARAVPPVPVPSARPPTAPVPGARQPTAPAAPAATARPAAAPVPSARPAAAPAPTATPAPSPQAAPRSGSRTAAPTQVSQSQLIEMHSPILNEVGDLTKRAEEEFRTGQTTNALVSLERATYLLERVAHAPSAMSQRLIKVLDDGLKEGAVADADRARREQVRERITAVLAAEG